MNLVPWSSCFFFNSGPKKVLSLSSTECKMWSANPKKNDASNYGINLKKSVNKVPIIIFQMLLAGRRTHNNIELFYGFDELTISPGNPGRPGGPSSPVDPSCPGKPGKPVFPDIICKQHFGIGWVETSSCCFLFSNEKLKKTFRQCLTGETPFSFLSRHSCNDFFFVKKKYRFYFHIVVFIEGMLSCEKNKKGLL